MGRACKGREMGRGPLAEGLPESGGKRRRRGWSRRFSPPGRLDDGRNGRGGWLWAPPVLRRDRSGPLRRLISRNRGEEAVVFRREFRNSDFKIRQIESQFSDFDRWVLCVLCRIRFLPF
ncbi:hypothetical protein CRG98_023661 [Punica granatum]|uniref:Uncharacterized protein n=1 Tax=Punica granatum TaxID=22663 RepID=A0A2I0JI40_PUNGR|nr:hypothetical protein CRG98_023661 [Punica granatum]